MEIKKWGTLGMFECYFCDSAFLVNREVVKKMTSSAIFPIKYPNPYSVNLCRSEINISITLTNINTEMMIEI